MGASSTGGVFLCETTSTPGKLGVFPSFCCVALQHSGVDLPKPKD